ncbi:thiamine-phosphate pyrophosphorylase [Sphingomonas sp. SORGH_AS870]|uniref:thiamine phosphate synthase n=1 Tax=Sphingomonas sp. SORGH_AS_0870 TaxID=3041801 RepID=UPI002863FAC9|nr:thiamine phosphate synthase [Sphingomonas sp. SORGH_AS_0870]MDR6144626.1 thiamine-phosphate pyrophosphorylase [Sphingomonas sp. SORGH_AS_0870]
MADRYPETWLMTDERLGDGLWSALRRLPPGSGVVFRHHATPPAARRAIHRRVFRIARARRLLLLVAGGGLPGDGVHKRGRGKGLRSWPAHDRAEAVAGWKAGADLLFVSPLFPTRSHRGAPSLGLPRAARIGRGLDLPRIALGGMTAKRFRRLRGRFEGWAAIDAWVAV